MFPRNVFAAGLAASLVLGGVLIAASLSSEVPDYGLIALVHRLVGGPSFSGWIGYFVVGVLVWPAIYGLIHARLGPTPRLFRGLIFACLAWAAMLFWFLPLAGAGLCGLVLGWSVPLITLVQHVVYGITLAGVHRPPAPSRKRKPR